MNKLNFKPTKTWINAHKARPTACVCPDIPCYCSLDHFNQHGHGFCVGITINKDDGLDMVRFCDRTYDSETNEGACSSKQWHPSEALLAATFLSFTVGVVLALIPEYRSQLGEMGRQRTRQLHKGVNHDKSVK